jgi:hypothetical protein
MSLKEMKDYAKDELKSDEKLLESILKFETLYKKHKIKLFAAIAVLALVAISAWGYNQYKDYKYNKANDALLVLVEKPDDKDALNELKNNNEELYELFSYKIACAKNDEKKLQELASSKNKMIADLSSYTLGAMNNKPVDSKYYQDLTFIMQAHDMIMKKDFKKANDILDHISEDSPLINVAMLYRHYTLSGVQR